jgi:hypothetical protein
VTDASAFTLAAIGLATGITLRVLHRNAEPPMLAVLIAGTILQIIAGTILHDWPSVFWGLGIAATGTALLAWDGRKGGA